MRNTVEIDGTTPTPGHDGRLGGIDGSPRGWTTHRTPSSAPFALFGVAGVRPHRERLSEVEILNSNPVLAVHDLARSAAWYRDVLGCETRDPDPGNWTFCRLGAIDFMLGRCPDALPASDLGDHSYLAYLRVDDVDAFHDRAVVAGAEITKPPTDEPWGMREFGLRSVDGHRFMLGQKMQN